MINSYRELKQQSHVEQARLERLQTRQGRNMQASRTKDTAKHFRSVSELVASEPVRPIPAALGPELRADRLLPPRQVDGQQAQLTRVTSTDPPGQAVNPYTDRLSHRILSKISLPMQTQSAPFYEIKQEQPKKRLKHPKNARPEARTESLPTARDQSTIEGSSEQQQQINTFIAQHKMKGQGA